MQEEQEAESSPLVGSSKNMTGGLFTSSREQQQDHRVHLGTAAGSQITFRYSSRDTEFIRMQQQGHRVHLGTVVQ